MKEEIIDPPADIEFDENGIGLFFQNPTEKELEKIDPGDRQWYWAINNNFPDRKFRKTCRIGYFNDDQWNIIKEIKEKINLRDDIIKAALVHCLELIFPHLYKNKIDYSDAHSIHKAVFKDKIAYQMTDVIFMVQKMISNVHENHIGSHFLEYLMNDDINRENDYFTKHVSKLSYDDSVRIKMYLLGAIRLCHYLDLK